MKRFSKIDMIVSSIVIIFVIALSSVLGALQISKTVCFGVNPFLLMLTVLTLGIGLYVTAFGIIKKGGYEYAVGSMLAVIGIVLLMVCLNLFVWLIVIIGVSISLIAFIVPFIIKANSLVVERTNEKPDFVPYSEKLKQEKQEEKEREEELPKIKSFKD